MILNDIPPEDLQEIRARHLETSNIFCLGGQWYRVGQYRSATTGGLIISVKDPNAPNRDAFRMTLGYNQPIIRVNPDLWLNLYPLSLQVGTLTLERVLHRPETISYRVFCNDAEIGIITQKLNLEWVSDKGTYPTAEAAALSLQVAAA